MYLNFEMPGEDRLVLLTEDALRLWKDIPGEKLTEAVEQAITQAGSFVATTGLVAKVWAEKKSKPLEHQLSHPYQGPALPPPEKTKEEIAEERRMCQEMIAKFGTSRP